MSLYRKTAVVQIELPSGASMERLPLTTDRGYGVILTIDGQSYPAGYFNSPINDDQWRDFSRRLSDCNTRHTADATAYRNATFIRGIGLSLYKGLAALNPQMQAFLDEAGGHRRLVIQTTRPELHLLPWGAMYSGGALLAAGHLSVVQAYDSFSASLAVTQSRLNLLRVEGTDTNFATAFALTKLPPEIVTLTPQDMQHPDILHVEAHGNRTTNKIGDVDAVDFSTHYGKTTLALLWSCYSGAADSWGNSPALCLHQAGALMVLSFQAELHVADAESIAEALYGDVFGPAASRNPESALVRIRADKFASEFAFANWASMTVYLRSPLDLSALPLNGPRVPAALWIDDAGAGPVAVAAADASTALFVAEASELANRPSVGAVADLPDHTDAVSTDVASGDGADAETAVTATITPVTGTTLIETTGLVAADPWAQVSEEIRKLQPGSWKSMAAPVLIEGATTKLPMSAFGAWRGNVIRLDGCDDPLTQAICQELDLVRLSPPAGDAAERLVWFFNNIAHYGSPLIVWTNSLPRHMEFLETIEPSPALTFLLLGGPELPDTIPSLVDQNRLDEARAASELLLKSADPICDEVLSAAYFACVRGMQPDIAKEFLKRLSSFQEWLVLTGNLFSRDRKNVLGTADLIALGARFLEGDSAVVTQEQLDQLHRPEDFYRLAMNQPLARSNPREAARAKHELAYLLQCQGKPGTAEVFYRLALSDLESCRDADEGSRHDSRWHFAIGAVLRDLADLLSTRRERADEASGLLKRAMAIQSYHGMQLQLGYSETTSARIWLTGAHHSHAINQAVNAANRMEQCVNWSGWGEALGILFDSLAESRETARMINLANLASEKIRASNLSKDGVAKQERTFKYEKAKAHWIAGDLVEARDELEGVRSDAPEEEKSAMDREIDRLLDFLRVEHAAPSTEVRAQHAAGAKKVR